MWQEIKATLWNCSGHVPHKLFVEIPHKNTILPFSCLVNEYSHSTHHIVEVVQCYEEVHDKEERSQIIPKVCLQKHIRMAKNAQTRAHTNTKKKYKSATYSYVLVCDICQTKLCVKAGMMFETHFAVVSVTIKLTIDSSSVWKYWRGQNRVTCKCWSSWV